VSLRHSVTISGKFNPIDVFEGRYLYGLKQWPSLLERRRTLYNDVLFFLKFVLGVPSLAVNLIPICWIFDSSLKKENNQNW